MGGITSKPAPTEPVVIALNQSGRAAGEVRAEEEGVLFSCAFECPKAREAPTFRGSAENRTPVRTIHLYRKMHDIAAEQSLLAAGSQADGHVTDTVSRHLPRRLRDFRPSIDSVLANGTKINRDWLSANRAFKVLAVSYRPNLATAATTRSPRPKS